MKKLTKILTVSLIAMTPMFVASCGEDDLEEAGDNVEEMAEDAGDALDDAADNVEDAADDAMDEID